MVCVCDTPRVWWETFSKALGELGMVQSRLDPCVSYWHWEEQSHGILAFHVDDMMSSMNRCQNSCGCDFLSNTGRKSRALKIYKEHRKNNQDPVTERERTKLRAIVGTANLLAVHAGLLQQKITRATVEDLIAANKLVSKVRDFSKTRITIRFSYLCTFHGCLMGQQRRTNF